MIWWDSDPQKHSRIQLGFTTLSQHDINIHEHPLSPPVNSIKSLTSILALKILVLIISVNFHWATTRVVSVIWLVSTAYTGPVEAKLNWSGRVRDCMRKHAVSRGSFGEHFSNLMFWDRFWGHFFSLIYRPCAYYRWQWRHGLIWMT